MIEQRQPIDGGRAWFNKTSAKVFEEDTFFDGNNHISVPTGTQWNHEELWRTVAGKWVKHSWSQWQGSGESWELLSDDEAYRWLNQNSYTNWMKKYAPESFAAMEV